MKTKKQRQAELDALLEKQATCKHVFVDHQIYWDKCLKCNLVRLP